MQALPVDEVLDEIVAAVRLGRNAVVQAPPGAGKTTRVPSGLYDRLAFGAGQVVVLEPRRIAARSAARRVAEERKSPVGQEVGYAVRFDQKRGPRTRLLFVTEGVFLRMLQDDPFLEGIAAVCFDEFHERSLDADLAIALTRAVQLDARPDLAIVAMSATLDAAPAAAFLGNCPIVTSVGRLFPIDVEYAAADIGFDVHEAIAAATHAIEQALASTSGDVLVFLPGVGEIRRLKNALRDRAEASNIHLAELYGDLAPERQDAAIRPGARRKIILATNVAETSLTVEGVAAVVDLGWARTPRHDLRVGLDRLELTRISRASAEQRAGRAGRIGPGRCWRLWSRRQHDRLAERETPAVARVDLAGPILQLLAWGERDPARFGWFEAPAAHKMDEALKLLGRLDAVDQHGAITTLGKSMARLPVQPRLARMLVEGRRLGEVHKTALTAALLSERDPFFGARHPARHASQSDVLDDLEALVERRAGESLQGLYEVIQRTADHLARTVLDEFGPPARPGPGASAARDLDSDEIVGRALLAGFPDRLCKRREPGGRRALMVGGRGVRLHDKSAVSTAELFVAVEADAGGVDDLVHRASAVDRSWLPNERLETVEALTFDESAKRVWGLRQTRWLDLPLEEAAVNPTDRRAVAERLAEAAAGRLAEALALDSEAFATLRARIACLAQWMPELALPTLDDAVLAGWLPTLCSGRKSFAELRAIDLASHALNALTHRQRQALEREAPERIVVPSGSRVALRYEPGKPPVLAVRIQELFGLTETPRVAAGRVGVLLHLLAPNYRPQQVTDDLRSFWTNTYPVVRKELRARYPKHAWPEDPWTAAAERRPRRPNR